MPACVTVTRLSSSRCDLLGSKCSLIVFIWQLSLLNVQILPFTSTIMNIQGRPLTSQGLQVRHTVSRNTHL